MKKHSHAYTGPSARTIGHKKYDELLLKVIQAIGENKSREDLLQLFLNEIKKTSSARSIVVLSTTFVDYENKKDPILKGIDQRGVHPHRWLQFKQSKGYPISPDSLVYKVIEDGVLVDVWGTKYFGEGFEILRPIFDIKRGGWISGIQLPRATAQYDNQGLLFWYLTGKKSVTIPQGAEQDWRLLKLFQQCYCMASYSIRKVAREIIMQRQEILRTLTPSILNHEINARISFFKNGLENTLNDLKLYFEITKDQDNSLEKMSMLMDSIYRRINKQLLPHAESLSKISESVMGLSRRIASGPTDPIKEINSAVELLTHKASDVNVLIEFIKIPNNPIEIVSDPALLMHIMVNLIKNAIEALEPLEIEFLDQRKRIWIEVEWVDEEELPLRISVCDNGSGIEQKTVGKIFEAGITTKKYGHGLGLAICKMVASYLGGTIEVSQFHNPTEFVLRLPKESPKIADLEEELKNAVEKP